MGATAVGPSQSVQPLAPSVVGDQAFLPGGRIDATITALINGYIAKGALPANFGFVHAELGRDRDPESSRNQTAIFILYDPSVNPRGRQVCDFEMQANARLTDEPYVQDLFNKVNAGGQDLYVMSTAQAAAIDTE